MQYTNQRTGESYKCRGNVTPEQCAERLGRRQRTIMVRVTGTRGLSGIWQGYRHLRGSLSSYGDNWHIG